MCFLLFNTVEVWSHSKGQLKFKRRNYSNTTTNEPNKFKSSHVYSSVVLISLATISPQPVTTTDLKPNHRREP